MSILRSRTWIFVALTLALSAAPLAAQNPRGGPPGPEGRQQMEERLRERMGRMVQERLGLTDAEMVELRSVMDDFQDERRSLARSEQATRRRVEALMLEGGEDGDEALELLSRLAELRREEASLFEREQEALLEVLTPVQVLQLHALREQISRRIRSLRGRRGPGNVDDPTGVALSVMTPAR